ncbi:MAG: TRAM domain-containing protein [Spirochaetes bacterium]|nr:TRAM domain-containing protein [Spirochaetota bacterium]
MIIFLRVVFIAMSMLLSSLFFVEWPFYYIIAAALVAGVASLLILILVEYILHTFPARLFAAAIIGLIIGFILGHLINLAYGALHITALDEYSHIITPLIYHLSGFFVMMYFIINYDEILFLDRIISPDLQSADEKMAYKILDTSVIIDGRIADLCDTGFIEGILVIPNFVLNELQMIADSADSIKRNRGRRGLDILNKMQKDQSIMVKITDMDFADISEVDAKLVKLAKIMNAKVITNDFNLNKVAEFHGVPVLNINQLSNALKPVVLPGEEMRVALIKEGKDQNQAIGYLDDGTMVVVENGRKRLNDEVDVTVTSVLQTTAGRMIFTRLKES